MTKQKKAIVLSFLFALVISLAFCISSVFTPTSAQKVDGKQELLEAGDGIKNWTAYIERIKKVPGERAIMTEFCKGGLPESFIADAAVLNRLAK